MKGQPGICAVCGTWRRILHRDHIIPRYKGGTNALINIQFLCANCHQDKTSIEQSDANKGRKHSAHTKAKISASNAGHSVSIETRAKISAAVRNAMTPELRARYSVAQKIRAAKYGSYWSGKKIPESTRVKLAEGLKAYFAIHGHPWTGRKHTEETKAKMSANKRAARLT